MNEKVVTELIQEDCTPSSIAKEIEKLVDGTDDRELMLNKYQQLIDKVGEAGASARAAKSIVQFIKA